MVRCGCRYKQTWKEDMFAIWKVWVPVQFFNFAFSPLWMRVPVTTIVSFFWTCYVSFVRGKPDDPKLLNQEQANNTSEINSSTATVLATATHQLGYTPHNATLMKAMSASSACPDMFASTSSGNSA